VLEPTTTITDYILAAECLVLGALLLRSEQTATRVWGLAFFTVALAAATGGTVHGFLSTKSLLWKVTIYSIGITSLLMLLAASIGGTWQPWRTVLIAAASIQFLLYAIWMANHDDFRYVIYNYAPAMIVVLLLQIFGRTHGGNRWIISGIIVSFLGAGIQRTGIVLHKNFNFNDIYHLVQMVAMFLLYRGGLLFGR
jgi:hypothetical protein